MQAWIDKVQRFLRSEEGPTAVEYSVMLMLIILVCLAAVALIGTETNTTYENMSRSLKP